MDTTRRGFLKLLGKTAAVAVVAAAVPKAALSKMVSKKPEKVFRVSRHGDTPLLELTPAQARLWDDRRDKYARSAGKAVGQRINEEFVKQFEINVHKAMKQKGSILRGH